MLSNKSNATYHFPISLCLLFSLLFSGCLPLAQPAKQDHTILIEPLMQKCESGDGQSCLDLASGYESGYLRKVRLNIEKNVEKSIVYFQKACDHEEVQSCVLLGVLYYEGKKTDVDLEKSALFYRKSHEIAKKSCQNNNIEGCRWLGHQYFYGTGTAVNYSKSAKYYQKNCNLGDQISCHLMGLMYESGHGVVKNEKKAMQIISQQCQQGHNYSCLYLQEKQENNTIELESLENGCKDGFSNFCHELGLIYFRGRGVPFAPKKAQQLLKNSCDLDYREGCNDLAIAYDTYNADISKVHDGYKRACELGHIGGCNSLGQLYETGKGGLPVDHQKALDIYQENCDYGNQMSCVYLKDLKAKLNVAL